MKTETTFEKAIQDAVKKEVARSVVDAVGIAKKTIDDQVPFIIAELLRSIVKRIIAERRGAELVLHFQMEADEPKPEATP